MATAGPDRERLDKARRIWTVPNMICIARIAATPGLCWWIASGSVIAVLCLRTGICDSLSGDLASPAIGLVLM